MDKYKYEDYMKAVEEVRIESFYFSKNTEAIILELLNKQKPIKVIDKGKDVFPYYEGECPVCDKDITEYMQFCPYCGHKLDWS